MTQPGARDTILRRIPFERGGIEMFWELFPMTLNLKHSVTRHKCKRESSVTSTLSEIIMVCKASN